MIVDTITEAKAQFSSLIEKVIGGEEIIIKKAGKPVAVLRRYSGFSSKRAPGALRNKIRISADFDQLPDDMAEAFGVKTK